MRRLLESRSASRDPAGIAFLVSHPGESKFQAGAEHLASLGTVNRSSTAATEPGGAGRRERRSTSYIGLHVQSGRREYAA
jgi:hypothetical protein